MVLPHHVPCCRFIVLWTVLSNVLDIGKREPNKISGSTCFELCYGGWIDEAGMHPVHHLLDQRYIIDVVCCIDAITCCCGLHAVLKIICSNCICCEAVAKPQVVVGLLEGDPPKLQLSGCGLLLAFDDWGC